MEVEATPSVTADIRRGSSIKLVRTDSGGLRILISGRLTANTLPDVWEELEHNPALGGKGGVFGESSGAAAGGVVAVARPAPGSSIEIDGKGIEFCDVAGVSVVLELERRAVRQGFAFTVVNWPEQFAPLLALFDVENFREATAKPPKLRMAEEVGRHTAHILEDLRTQVAFVGELGVALVFMARRPREVRWNDVIRIAEQAGANALPLSMMIGFLIGLIMAFQSAIPMKQFGAEIFVANLVALTMTRELGPLMTAIVVTGRTGSAFAAELGTMKVSEEINALQTMGLDPMKFLVVPRVIATVLMTPLLTIFANVAGIIGGLVVVVGMGYPVVAFFNQMMQYLKLGDILSGLVKSFVFGVIVAGVGCMRGLQTKNGASAVGDSTTRAVVTSIILVAITDAIIAIICYSLNI